MGIWTRFVVCNALILLVLAQLMLLGGVCFLPFSSRRMHQFFLQLAIGEHQEVDHTVYLKVMQQYNMFSSPSITIFLTLQFVLFLVCHGYKVLQQFGAPSFRPFSALKEWASRALPSTDFQYASMSLVFLPRIPTRLVFVPSTVLATYHVMLYVALHYQHTALWEKYGRKLHKTMVEKQVRHWNVVGTQLFHFLNVFNCHFMYSPGDVLRDTCNL